MDLNLELLLKEAVLFGAVVGIVAAGIFVIVAAGRYLLAPKVAAVAASMPPPFGFQLPK